MQVFLCLFSKYRAFFLRKENPLYFRFWYIAIKQKRDINRLVKTTYASLYQNR
jgi:hypothetical protein